ncbi:MAG: hypothetical protein RMK01_06980 [Thermomicrobium sp.]|nr:hypothetical protein [Thermomicrobium sp.]
MVGSWSRWQRRMVRGALCGFLLAWWGIACSGGSSPSPVATPIQPVRSVVTPTSSPPAQPTPATERVELVIRRSTLQEVGTNQAELVVDVTLPDACTEPRWAVSRDGARVVVELWGERPVGLACAQVIREGTVTVPLGMTLHGGFVVELNGVEIVPGEDVEGSQEPGTNALEYGLAMVEQVEVRVGEGVPAQVEIDVQGSLPDACAELVEDPTIVVEGQRVTVQVEWQRPRDLVCAQVLRPFTTTIPLGAFPPGEYTLVVNDMELTFTVADGQP